MEMRAAEAIAIAEDLTPPLPPLAFSLHDSFLSSHCSACSFPLPSNPHSIPTFPTNPSHHAVPSYCSPRCSSLDFSSSVHHLPPHNSSHLRLALRLLQKLNDAFKMDRIAGLLTNYERFMDEENKNKDDDDVLGMIKEGARSLVVTRGKGDGGGGGPVAAVEEAVMCLVLTNAVEVQDEKGRNIGIAVYDWRFSWINHSCSPNACYRFLTTSPPEMKRESRRLRIYPAAMDGGAAGGAEPAGDYKSSEGYGPRIVVRSIKRIKKDEEVTIAYTDLLQPKELRQSELQVKYQFNCCCTRCGATPATYVDRALEEISVCSIDGFNMGSDDKIYRCKATKKLMDSFDNAIDEYLTYNNPESCCEKLEELLSHGYFDEQLKQRSGKSRQCIKLHQFHHLSLNAYITLASAYHVRASELLAFSPENHQHQVEAFSLSRTSAAYSLLLTVIMHRLFLSESSLIASVANFWKNAGESLVHVSRSSVWNTDQTLQSSLLENSSIVRHNCYKIVQMHIVEANSIASSQDQNVTFGEINRQFLNCIVDIAAKVWSFLTHEGRHLQEIKDLIDFRLLLTMESSLDFGTDRTLYDTRTVSAVEVNELTDEVRINLFQLGVHYLMYGAYLSSLCYGRHSHLTSDIVNLLRSEGIFAG